MKKFEDNFPMFMDYDDYHSLRREYSYHGVKVDNDGMVFWSNFIFYTIPVVLVVILNFLMHISIFYVPLYFVFSTIAEMIIEYLYARVIPQRKINNKLAEEEKERLATEAKKAEEKMMKEIQDNVFSKEKMVEILEKYKAVQYPSYVSVNLNKLFKKLEILIKACDDPQKYRSLFVNHLPEILNIIVKTKETPDEITLAKRVVDSVNNFVSSEIKRYKLGVSLDENSTLNAYINLYSQGSEIGGK